MVQAIGASPKPGPNLMGATPGALQAQLAQAERLLEECIHCESASTTEGKAKIQNLAARVQNLRHRLEELRNARAGNADPVPAQDNPQEPVPPVASPGPVGLQVDMTA